MYRRAGMMAHIHVADTAYVSSTRRTHSNVRVAGLFIGYDQLLVTLISRDHSAGNQELS